ncbi:MAG TPA: adenylate/guanylate cyclase domain-containing protein, partial [Rhodospirillales bacterium]|nr:adenylate/guanylate cyclase domain-containing protein [Rhodospirillales bacterium]
LDIQNPQLDYPILEELKSEGATDYVAMPLKFTNGLINVISMTTGRAGGFTAEDLGQINEILPVLSRLFEVHAARRTAVTLLDTYLGSHTGERILKGLIKRGDGEDIHAVIWFSDLRGSTPLAESMPRKDFLSILNRYFDCMAGAVLDHGGEVLRFIGDAALAIFPTSESGGGSKRCATAEACAAAVAAAKDAVQRMAAFNRERAKRGDAPLGFGIGIHMGDLTYGNIGALERLEFTVIGAAVNETARLEGMCKTLKKPVLISDDVAHGFAGGLVSLGEYRLRGVGRPREIFTLRKDPNTFV